ncbi:MAG: 1-acyl-sn-glycerol-3-phosphate acyltransferase [Acidobacteria bacterium]|nr:1-acyl-sn-glycerol-3-phosphate acyltransferase [Acidobacteriota bacterium]
MKINYESIGIPKLFYYIFKIVRSFLTHLTLYILLLIIGPSVILLLLFFRKKFPTRAAFIWSLFTCAVGGIEVDLKNRHYLNKDDIQIIIANHQSSFDIHALIIALNPFYYRFVAKKELSFLPIFGWALWLSGFPLVDRKDNEQAVRSMKALEEQLRKEKMKVVIFPEGTRNKNLGLLPFKKGAFVLATNLQCEIVPAVLIGTRGVQKRHSFFINPGKITVKFLPPISTKGLSYEDRESLIEKCFNEMYSALPDDEKPIVKEESN